MSPRRPQDNDDVPFRPSFPPERVLVWDYRQILRKLPPTERQVHLQALARQADEDDALKRYLQHLGWVVSQPGQPTSLVFRTWGGRRPGAGAPRGNMNAYVHGKRSARALLMYQLIAALIANPESRPVVLALLGVPHTRYRVWRKKRSS